MVRFVQTSVLFFGPAGAGRHDERLGLIFGNAALLHQLFGVEIGEIVSRLDAAGYSVTAGEGTTGASMVATGQFAAFADVNVSWSIYGTRMSGGATSIPDMICIVGFASIEDAEKYETAMVELVNSQLEAQGMDISFESLADYMAYFGEVGISLPMVYEMRGDCFVYATGSGADDAFGE